MDDTILTLSLKKGEYEDVHIFTRPDKLKALAKDNGILGYFVRSHLRPCGECFFECDSHNECK